MPVDFKKVTAPLNTKTWNTAELSQRTGNIYEMVNIITKRANQISVDLKEELGKKLQEFSSYTDNLEEVFENREQIEISKYYERLPKPVSIATQEFVDNKIYYRRPVADDSKSYNSEANDYQGE
ncbi:MAG: DNA-directed RNA polymerase subunit omega [Bacteroidales bacterium]|jgi:DNA-directed RNA polymerase subunit K/omega|nr:DNA-directed RNA polymerase subunit omega [Bacteroidales bacterium]